MAAMVTECGNVRIITQVIQQKDPQGAEVLSESGSTSMSSQLTRAQPKSFANTLPKALGVVQIVLGATQISFGIALTVAQEDLKKLTVKSGVYFWIGILLLLSGALLVEMEKRDHALLGRLCLLVNLLVSGASVVAVILHGTEIGEETVKDNICGGSSEYYCSNAKQKKGIILRMANSNLIKVSSYKKFILTVLVYGMNSVFIILSLLELAISLTAVVVVFKSTKQQSYRQMASR